VTLIASLSGVFLRREVFISWIVLGGSGWQWMRRW
jgi:hypothetical protein